MSIYVSVMVVVSLIVVLACKLIKKYKKNTIPRLSAIEIFLKLLTVI